MVDFESLDQPTLISRKMSMTINLHFMNFSVKSNSKQIASHESFISRKIHNKMLNEIFKKVENFHTFKYAPIP